MDELSSLERIEALDWLSPETIAVLDTETTGLDDRAEVLEVAILDGCGEKIYHSYAMPAGGISPQAQAVHGISAADLIEAGAPTFDAIAGDIAAALFEKTVIIYNASYDMRLLAQSARARGFTMFCGDDADTVLKPSAVLCAMNAFCDYRGVTRWQRLIDAAWHFNVSLPKGATAHRAAADCAMTIDICRGMCGLPPIATTDNAERWR